MMKLMLVLLMVAAVHGNVVKRSDSVCAGPTQLTAEQIQEALDAHNAFRSTAGNGDAANVMKMRWSDELASRAQDWANKCQFVHQMTTLCDGVTSVGQNLYMGGAALGTNITRFIQLWNDEKEDYNYSDGSCSNVCGHYTQVVWANSVEVGCAMNHCDNLDYVCSLKSQNAIVFACNYSPSGNYWGQQPYNQGAPCSDCGSVIDGGYKCEDNLCVECSPEEDPDCQCAETIECQNGGSWYEGTCQCMCDLGNFYGRACENRCECVDSSPHCNYWKNKYCSNPPYRAFMQENCAATCNLCDLPDTCN